MAEKVVYVTDRSFDAASGVLCRNFFVIGADQELVFPRGGEEQRHPAIFEAVAPPPARDKASDPRVMRRLSLLVDDCWVVAVIGAVLRKVGHVFNPLVNRIAVRPPQHDPSQQPQHPRWRNASREAGGRCGAGLGGTSPTPFRTRAWEQYPALGKTAQAPWVKR